MVAPERTPSGATSATAPPAPAPLRTELTTQVVSRVRGALGSITPTVVVVRGEAGSGKSTFSREIAGAARARVVVQTSIAAESSFVHVALTDLVDALAAGGRGEPIDGGEAAPTVPTLGLRLRDRITDAAADGPLVVVLDDLQWIDRDSLDVVTFAVRRLRDVAVVVVVAVRPPLGAAGDDPTAALEAADRLDVDLAPVPSARLRALVQSVAPDLTGDDVDAVVGQAGGNPFWAAELARSGAVRAGSGVDLRRTSPTARERLAALASALTEEQRVVVAAVRLAGRPPSDELRAAVATEVADPAVALEQAEAAGLVTLVGQRWTTVHPLLGEAALQVLPAARRVALLRRLAAAAVDPERRVHLAAEVQRAPHEPTARELAGVAEWAAARGSLQSAVGLMERSVQFTADTDERRRGERLAALASLHLRRGAFADVLATADSVDLDLLGSGAFDTLATAVADASALVFGRARAQAAVARVEASAARRGDPMSRAVAAALTADRDYGTAQDPYAVAVAAAAVLEGATWPSPATHTVLGSVGTLGLDRGDGLDEAVVERRRRLEPRLRKAGLMPPSTGSADAHVAYVSKELGDPLTSLRRLPALVEAADRVGEEFAAFAFRVHLAAAHQVCGGFGASRALLAEAGRSNSRVPPPRFPMLLPARVRQALADEGSVGAAEVLAAEAPNPTVGPSRWRLAVDHLAGSVAVVAGRHDEALEHLERAMDTAVRVGILEPGRRFHVDALLVETHLARGDLDRAEQRLAELDAFCRPRGRADAVVAIDRLTGLLLAARGELGPAEALLSAASDRASASPFRVEHARTAAALAEVHARRGDPRTAADTFAAVRTAFVRMPFAAGVELVDRRMRELRLTDDPHALSPAERAVVDAVVAGLTARQTGEQLHISHRTVEAHLRAVYRKLDVKGRVELTALALRGDLDRAAPPLARRD